MQQWKLIHDVERAMASRHELTDKKPRKEPYLRTAGYITCDYAMADFPLAFA